MAPASPGDLLRTANGLRPRASSRQRIGHETRRGRGAGHRRDGLLPLPRAHKSSGVRLARQGPRLLTPSYQPVPPLNRYRPSIIRSPGYHGVGTLVGYHARACVSGNGVSRSARAQRFGSGRRHAATRQGASRSPRDPL